MGTRSLTFVYEKYGQIQKPVVNKYREGKVKSTPNRRVK